MCVWFLLLWWHLQTSDELFCYIYSITIADEKWHFMKLISHELKKLFCYSRTINPFLTQIKHLRVGLSIVYYLIENNIFNIIISYSVSLIFRIKYDAFVQVFVNRYMHTYIYINQIHDSKVRHINLFIYLCAQPYNPGINKLLSNSKFRSITLDK